MEFTELLIFFCVLICTISFAAITYLWFKIAIMEKMILSLLSKPAKANVPMIMTPEGPITLQDYISAQQKTPTLTPEQQHIQDTKPGYIG